MNTRGAREYEELQQKLIAVTLANQGLRVAIERLVDENAALQMEVHELSARCVELARTCEDLRVAAPKCPDVD
jgi:regulator of replication initiation timing